MFVVGSPLDLCFILAAGSFISLLQKFIKFHKFQVPVEINHAKLIKAIEKELRNDMVYNSIFFDQ